MNRKNLIGRLGAGILLVSIPFSATAMLANQEKQKQKIVQSPSTFVEYTVQSNDKMDSLIKKYSKIPTSVDPRDVREYVKEINKKKTSDLYSGERIKIPVYESKKGEKK